MGRHRFLAVVGIPCTLLEHVTRFAMPRYSPLTAVDIHWLELLLGAFAAVLVSVVVVYARRLTFAYLYQQRHAFSTQSELSA